LRFGDVMQGLARTVSATLRGRLDDARLDWALVCGSGVAAGLVRPDGLGLDVEGQATLAELGLPPPRVSGHAHAIVWGRVGERRVAIQTGRLHPYEGHPVETCTAALEAMMECGAGAVALTCAVGALRDALEPGDLCVIRDQINLLGPTPLVGPRFVDCSGLYDASLRARLQRIARSRGEALREVIYAHCRGPQYETPAEVEALRRLGADIVGMSTTYEAIAAAARGGRTCALAVVANAAGAAGVAHDDVCAKIRPAAKRLGAVLRALIVDAQDPL
jgi:purine-nucleoside phosphorylase